DVIEEVTRLEKELQDIEIEYAAENQKIISMDENIEKLEQRREKIKKEIEDLGKQKIDNRTEKEEKEERINYLTSETQKLSEIVEEYAANNKENQKYIDDLNFDITNLKISVSSFDESGS